MVVPASVPALLLTDKLTIPCISVLAVEESLVVTESVTPKAVNPLRIGLGFTVAVFVTIVPAGVAESIVPLTVNVADCDGARLTFPQTPFVLL